VPEELWVAAHARMDQTRETYARAGFGRMMGKPSRLDLESPYRLSGMGKCGVCGGSLIAMTRKHGKRHGESAQTVLPRSWFHAQMYRSDPPRRAQRATMLDVELLLISMKTSRLVKIITEGSAAAPPLIEALGREEARKQTVISP